MLILVIFEPIAIYFAFLGYKEFYGTLLDGGSSAGQPLNAQAAREYQQDA